MEKSIIKSVIGSLHKEIRETKLVNRPMTFESNVCYVPQEGMAVQASFDINEEETREREVSALVALNKVFPLQKALIITRDTELRIESEGLVIEILPIWKWLLKK